jgi:tight adherence protein B
MLTFLLVVVFLGCFGLVVASYTFLNRRALARHHAAKRRIRTQAGDVNPDVSIWRDSAASAIPALNNWLDQLSHTEWLRRELRTAGVGSRPSEIMLGAAVMGLAAYLLGLTALGSRPLAMLFALLAAAVPYVYIRQRKRARLRKFEEQLPEAMDMLVNAMRAGYSFQAAMEFVARESAAPLGEEFARFHEEHRLGVDVRTALLNLLGRLPSVDLKMFATAVLIQRETGGNLGEVLTNISAMLRERFRIQGELRTLTAHVRLSAKILGVLPIGIALVTLAVNPEFVAPLYLEPMGRIMLGIAVAAQVLGFAVMHRLADIEF